MKKYIIIVLVCMFALVGCNKKTEKHIIPKDNLTVSEKETEETSSQELITETLTTDETTTKETTTEKSTTEQPATTVEKFTDVPHVDESVYKPNGKTPQLMKDVLLSKAEFTFVETKPYTNEKVATWSMVLSEFNYWVDRFDDMVVAIYDYRVFDLDEDGYNEVMITLRGNNNLILHYEDNKVYGFMYADRGMLNIYTSGIFEGSSGAAYTTYSTMSFDKDFYEVTDVVGWENNKFFIEGRDATQEEVIEYMDNDKFDYAIPRYKDVESILNME